MKRAIRLAILAGATVVLAHVLIDDGRSNWLALIPGAVVALAISHRIASRVSRRSIERNLATSYRVRPAPDFVPDPDLYPFASRWFESSAGRVHYLDEGEGRPLVLMHGNPDWSFLYRDMIPLLSQHFRCIAMDYPGFGLSDHPSPHAYGYRPQDHARIAAELMEHLDLDDAVMVTQDWGGPIGMDVASRSPQRFTGLVSGNTFFFPALRLQRIFGTIMNNDIMRHQVMKRSLFVRKMLPTLLQRELTETEFRHYDDVAPTYASRIGHARFLSSITGEREWLADLERRVDAHLTDKPLLRVLGYRDKPLTTGEFVAKWNEKFPHATLLDLPDAGHFWQEDEPRRVADAIRETFAREHTPPSGRSPVA